MTVLACATRSQLVVVDFQERLLKAVHGADAAVRRGRVLIEAAAELSIPTLITEQYPDGIGSTDATIRESLSENAKILEKITFAASADPAIAAHVGGLRNAGRDQLVIAGCEAHICVLQTALGFRAMGYEIFVVADAVSSRDPQSVSLALDRLRQAGCAIVNSEMVVFEWMERAGTDTFRRLLKLIK